MKGATPPAMRRDCRSESLRRLSSACFRPADALRWCCRPVEMQRFRSAALGRLYPVRWTEVCSTPRRGVRRILAEFCTTPVPAPEPARLIIELGGPDSYTEDYRRLTGDFYLKF